MKTKKTKIKKVDPEQSRCERRRAALLGWMTETMEKFERVADELSTGGARFGLIDDMEAGSAQRNIEDAIISINTAIHQVAGAVAKPKFLEFEK